MSLLNDLKAIQAKYQDDIFSNKNADKINGAITKILSQQNGLSVKEYDKLVGFLSSKLRKAADSEKPLLQAVKAELQRQGNALVNDHLILPNGRLPNASMLVLYTAAETGNKMVILIRNNKFGEFTTPGGKLDKVDMPQVASASVTPVDIASSYVNGAAREFCEEALAPQSYDAFKAALASATVVVADRDLLGIKERNQDYDTRILCADLGVCSQAEVAKWVKSPEPDNADAAETFCVSVESLAYSNLAAKQSGPYTNHFLTLTDHTGEAVTLKVRPTFLITLNGPVDKPELGFKVQANDNNDDAMDTEKSSASSFAKAGVVAFHAPASNAASTDEKAISSSSATIKQAATSLSL